MTWLKVLVVEDEALLAAEIEFMLADAGFTPIGCAFDSREALDLLRREKPDLALVDIHLLDGPTGVEVARSASADHNVVSVFMTANRKRIPDDFAGACGAVSKPYTEWGMIAALKFIEGCMRDGVATKAVPSSLDLAPDWAARWKASSGASAAAR